MDPTIFQVEPIELTNQPVASTRTWNQIAKSGTFKGHHQGAFTLDGKVFADIVRNFREVDGGRIPCDFDHATECEPNALTGAPAQSWIVDLQVREGPHGPELWGLIDWLSPARDYVKEGRIRSVSPAIRLESKHPETGKAAGARLSSVAFTARPFLRSMTPLAARDVASPNAAPRSQPMTTEPKMSAHATFHAAAVRERAATARKEQIDQRARRLGPNVTHVLMSEGDGPKRAYTLTTLTAAYRRRGVTLERAQQMAQAQFTQAARIAAERQAAAGPPLTLSELAQRIKRDKGVTLEKAQQMAVSIVRGRVANAGGAR